MDRKQTNFTVKDVPAGDFIAAYAEHLKKNKKITVPKWSDFVKTGKAKETAPQNDDWLYIRTAALARKIYLRGHLGVSTLTHIYGGKQRFGVRRNHHESCSGKIIRYCLQQLEGMKVIKKDKKDALKKLSRVFTKEGHMDLNQIATQVALKNQL